MGKSENFHGGDIFERKPNPIWVSSIFQDNFRVASSTNLDDSEKMVFRPFYYDAKKEIKPI